MSSVVELTLTSDDGTVELMRVPLEATLLRLDTRQLLAVSDNVAQLSNTSVLQLFNNSFTALPACVLPLTRLSSLDASNCCLRSVPPEIGRFEALSTLYVRGEPFLSSPA